MTEATTEMAKQGGITGDELRSVKFAKAFGRGYEQHEVDTFVERCSAWIEWFNEQLHATEQEIARLNEKLANASRGDEVQQAISILTGAQKTADITVKQADSYSTTVMSEARDLYESARLRTANLEQETDVKVKALWEDASVRSETIEREAAVKAKALFEDSSARSETLEREAAVKAKALFDEASARAAALEHETEEKVTALLEDARARAEALNQETQAKMEEFGITAAVEQKQLDTQTAYLRTLRDASRIQMQKFLEGLLDHISEEYGRANPVAAQAAAEPRQQREGAGGPSRPVNGRRRSVRKSYRIAGQSTLAQREQSVPHPRQGDDDAPAGVLNSARNGEVGQSEQQ